jgi:micrococcal nuclease
MKNILFFCAVLATTPAFAGQVFSPRVVDGDTFVTEVKPYPNLSALSARIVGVDTPEKRGKCDAEKQKAIEATRFLANLVENKIVTYEAVRWDKYGGRVNVIAYVDGVNVGDLLISAGHARPYFGGPRGGWCE